MNWMPHLRLTLACSIASISPLSRATSAAVVPSPLIKNRLGQNRTKPTPIATASPVALLFCAPVTCAALDETRLASSRNCAQE